jgi:hypothetical protein
MNQFAYVELPHVKNEKLYRLHVPFGVQWKEVRDAMLEMVVELSKDIEEIDRQEKARLEEQVAEAKRLAEAAKIEEKTNPSSVADGEIIPPAE